MKVITCCVFVRLMRMALYLNRRKSSKKTSYKQLGKSKGKEPEPPNGTISFGTPRGILHESAVFTIVNDGDVPEGQLINELR